MKNYPHSCEHNLCNCVKKPGFIVHLVRALHQYRVVKGSNPGEVLNIFQISLHNCTTGRIIFIDYRLFEFHSSIQRKMAKWYNCKFDCLQDGETNNFSASLRSF